MYRFMENIWDHGIEIYYFFLKLIFKDHLDYNLYLLENNSELED